MTIPFTLFIAGLFLVAMFSAVGIACDAEDTKIDLMFRDDMLNNDDMPIFNIVFLNSPH